VKYWYSVIEMVFLSPAGEPYAGNTTMNKRGYLPTLDGWRAIAVFCVILFHDRVHSFAGLSTAWFQEHGSFGVDIFFGISGLLICSRLMDEEQKYGAVSLKRFYVRRAFRILPPLLCYLLVIALVAMAAVIAVDAKEWIASLLFCRNYTFLGTVAGHANWYTGHFWSLAIEEHFYLLLPGILVFVPRARRIPVLVGLCLAVEALRSFRLQTTPWLYLFQHTEIRLDALLIPAILAIWMTKVWWHERIKKVAQFWPLTAIVTVGVVTLDRFPMVSKLMEPVLIPVTLLGTVLFSGGVFGRALELPILSWIGRLSYSLYLWQQFFFTGHYFAPLGFWQEAPWNWLLLFGCAAASYYWVERPLMLIGHRLAPPATPGRTDLEERPSIPGIDSNTPSTVIDA
jgi:peptidoglycan/LPS O-acetylase OafA/YrhL